VPPLPQPRVLVATLGDEAKRKGVKLLSDMRMADVGAVIAFRERSLRSQLREADKQEVRYVVMIGPDELRDQVVTVRDMSTRDQYTVPMDELARWLTERLAG